MRRIAFHTITSAFCAHGRVAHELMRQLLLRNITPEIITPTSAEDTANMPPYIRNLVGKFDADKRGFTWLYAQLKIATNPRNVRYLVHESDRQTPEWIDWYNNNSAAICTPSCWNAQMLQDCGITVPIHVLPHGVASDFNYSPIRQDKVVFATVGELMNNPGFRKNPEKIIKAFQEAFPTVFDGTVELWIKCQPSSPIVKPDDPRIKVFRDNVSQRDLIKWIEQTTVYVNGSRGEGWCMPVHEFMACGRPFVSTFWGGLTEYLTQESGWIVPHKLEMQRQDNFYAGQQQAEPDFKYMVEVFRHIYSNPGEVAQRGLNATKAAHKFNWNTVGAMLDRICNLYELVDNN